MTVCFYCKTLHCPGYDSEVQGEWCMRNWVTADCDSCGDYVPGGEKPTSIPAVQLVKIKAKRRAIVSFLTACQNHGVKARASDIARSLAYPGHNLRARHLDIMAQRGQIERDEDGYWRIVK